MSVISVHFSSVSYNSAFLFSMISKIQKTISVISINIAIKIAELYMPRSNTANGIMIEKA